MNSKDLNDLADQLEHTIIRAGEGTKEKFLADMKAAAALADRFIPILRMAAILHRYNIDFGQYLPDSVLWYFRNYDAHYEFEEGGRYKLGIERFDRERGKCLLSIKVGYVDSIPVEFNAAPGGDVWIDLAWTDWKYGIRHNGTPLIQEPKRAQDGPRHKKDNPLITEPWNVPAYRNAPVLFLKYFPVFEKHFVKYVKKVIKKWRKENC